MIKKKKPLLEGHKCTLTSEIPLLDTGASQLFQNLTIQTATLSHALFLNIYIYQFTIHYLFNFFLNLKKKNMTKRGWQVQAQTCLV